MLDVNIKAVQQINFTGNLEGTANTTMFFILGNVKETILDVSQGNATVLQTHFMNFTYSP